VPTLTRAERRGALIVLALFALGAAHDLWRITRPAPPAAAVAAPGAIAPDVPGAPSGDSAGTMAPAVTRPETPVTRVDLNRADARALDGLPGIGPVIAGRILERRARQGPFRTPEDLLAVRGIGPAVFARLRDRVTIGSSDSAGVHSAAPR
jgi:competence ComEA-like helix-hairpin-helix protein